MIFYCKNMSMYPYHFGNLRREGFRIEDDEKGIARTERKEEILFLLTGSTPRGIYDMLLLSASTRYADSAGS